MEALTAKHFYFGRRGVGCGKRKNRPATFCRRLGIAPEVNLKEEEEEAEVLREAPEVSLNQIGQLPSVEKLLKYANRVVVLS